MFTLVVFGLLLQGLVVLASYPVQSLRNARCNGILPTPTYGVTGSLFTVCAEELIAAPVSRIYDTLIDFRNYHIWNSFVIDVKVPATVINPSDVSVGMSMDFTTQGLLPLLNSTSTEIVTVLSPGTDFAVNAWRSDDKLNGMFMAAEHPNVLTDAGNGLTRYVSWETYYLPGGVLLLTLQAQLKTQFIQQGKDLKKYVEGLN